MPDFAAFIDRLANTPTDADAYNEYGAGPSLYNELRRANLLRYLNDIAAHKPRIALITEAPGYKGMRLTGMPMVSRRRLREGIPSLALFGTARGYIDVQEPGFERISGEQSGTILWDALAELNTVPIVWNAYPFHPHILNETFTNRTPRRPEVKIGSAFVRDILDMFQPEKVVAVGNIAYGTLTELGIPCEKIRHPAQGGKNDFVAGLRAQIAAFKPV